MRRCAQGRGFLALFLFSTSIFFEAQAIPTRNEIEVYEKLRHSEKTEPRLACEGWKKYPRSGPEGRLAEFRRALVCPGFQPLEIQENEAIWFGPWVHQHLSQNLQRIRSENLTAEDREWLLQELESTPNLNVPLRDRMRLIEEAMQIAQGKEELKAWLPRLARVRETLAPRFREKITPADFEAVIQDYIENLEYAQLRNWISSQLENQKLSLPDQFRLRLAEAQSYKRQQFRKKNLASLKQLHQWTQKNIQDPALRFEALTLYGRALWTAGQLKPARKLFKKAAAEFKSQPNESREYSAELYWLLARMSEEEKKYKDSNRWAVLGQKAARANSSLDEKLRFLEAWNLRKLGENQLAIKRLKILSAMDRSPSEKSKYAFWMGWISEKLKRPKNAQEYFDLAESFDPFGYYNILSHVHRKKPFPALGSVVSEGDSATPKGVGRLNSTAESLRDEWTETLLLLKEDELLVSYSQARLAEAKISASFDQSLYFASALSKVGSHLPLIRLFNSMNEEDRRWQFFMEDPERLFPRKYLPLVEEAAKKNGLPVEFVLSIIRQESTFDPRAKSPADALGLMQVLASLGPQFAKRLKLRYESFEDLYRPEINIPMGTLLLGDLYKRFKGNIFLTAASYNANPAAVRRWVKARSKQSFIEFMEEVPYEETRTYMKLLLRNFVYYRRIAEPTKSIPAPEECIESLQFPKLSTGKKKK